MSTPPWKRSVLSDVQASPQTFSSWNNCRHSSRGKKHLDESIPHKSAPPTTSGYTPTQPPSYAPPQFATFATSHKEGAGGKPVNEDALPAMPTWESARTRKVLLEAEPSHKGHVDDVELGDLNHSKKATGSRAPMLAHAAPPAGYDDIGVATPMQSPYGNPQDPGHGVGYAESQDFAGGYRRVGTPKSPYGQSYGSPQQMPEGPYYQDHHPRSSHGTGNHNEDYFSDDAQYQPPLHQANASGYGNSTRAYGHDENFHPQIRNGYTGANTRSPPPTFQNGGFGLRSQSPFNQDNSSYDRGNTRTPPVQRQNVGGYTGDAPHLPPIKRSPTADLPDILTAGPKSPPLVRHQNNGGPYRPYSPSPASPTYAAYRPRQ
ncbi:MAG: hypothetical protein M1839_001401 [Geoglossum umbratile]|nr:MAG: hypothetical protein M1839_001401 [Geoglossum umbratile]